MLDFATCGLQNTRHPCPSLSPGICSNSCPLRFSDAIKPSHSFLPPSPFAFHLSKHQGLFQWVCSLYQVATNIGASTSASVFQMNIQGWFPFGIDWSDLLAVQGTLQSHLQHHNLKASIFWCSAVFRIQLSHLSVNDYWKDHSFDCDHTLIFQFTNVSSKLSGVNHSVLSNSLQAYGRACQFPLSMEFSRQEYWSELPFPSP